MTDDPTNYGPSPRDILEMMRRMHPAAWRARPTVDRTPRYVLADMLEEMDPDEIERHPQDLARHAALLRDPRRHLYLGFGAHIPSIGDAADLRGSLPPGMLRGYAGRLLQHRPSSEAPSPAELGLGPYDLTGGTQGAMAADVNTFTSLFEPRGTGSFRAFGPEMGRLLADARRGGPAGNWGSYVDWIPEDVMEDMDDYVGMWDSYPLTVDEFNMVSGPYEPPMVGDAIRRFDEPGMEQYAHTPEPTPYVDPEVEARNQATLANKRRNIVRHAQRRYRSRLAQTPTEELAARIAALIAEHGPLRKTDIVNTLKVAGAPLDAALAHGGFRTETKPTRADGSGRKANWYHPPEQQPEQPPGGEDTDVDEYAYAPEPTDYAAPPPTGPRFLPGRHLHPTLRGGPLGAYLNRMAAGWGGYDDAVDLSRSILGGFSPPGYIGDLRTDEENSGGNLVDTDMAQGTTDLFALRRGLGGTGFQHSPDLTPVHALADWYMEHEDHPDANLFNWHSLPQSVLDDFNLDRHIGVHRALDPDLASFDELRGTWNAGGPFPAGHGGFANAFNTFRGMYATPEEADRRMQASLARNRQRLYNLRDVHGRRTTLTEMYPLEGADNPEPTAAGNWEEHPHGEEGFEGNLPWLRHIQPLRDTPKFKGGPTYGEDPERYWEQPHATPYMDESLRVCYDRGGDDFEIPYMDDGDAVMYRRPYPAGYDDESTEEDTSTFPAPAEPGTGNVPALRLNESGVWEQTKPVQPGRDGSRRTFVHRTARAHELLAGAARTNPKLAAWLRAGGDAGDFGRGDFAREVLNRGRRGEGFTPGDRVRTPEEMAYLNYLYKLGGQFQNHQTRTATSPKTRATPGAQPSPVPSRLPSARPRILNNPLEWATGPFNEQEAGEFLNSPASGKNAPRRDWRNPIVPAPAPITPTTRTPPPGVADRFKFGTPATPKPVLPGRPATPAPEWGGSVSPKLTGGTPPAPKSGFWGNAFNWGKNLFGYAGDQDPTSYDAPQQPTHYTADEWNDAVAAVEAIRYGYAPLPTLYNDPDTIRAILASLTRDARLGTADENSEEWLARLVLADAVQDTGDDRTAALLRSRHPIVVTPDGQITPGQFDPDHTAVLDRYHDLIARVQEWAGDTYPEWHPRDDYDIDPDPESPHHHMLTPLPGYDDYGDAEHIDPHRVHVSALGDFLADIIDSDVNGADYGWNTDWTATEHTEEEWSQIADEYDRMINELRGYEAVQPHPAFDWNTLNPDPQPPLPGMESDANWTEYARTDYAQPFDAERDAAFLRKLRSDRGQYPFAYIDWLEEQGLPAHADTVRRHADRAARRGGSTPLAGLLRSTTDLDDMTDPDVPWETAVLADWRSNGSWSSGGGRGPNAARLGLARRDPDNPDRIWAWRPGPQSEHETSRGIRRLISEARPRIPAGAQLDGYDPDDPEGWVPGEVATGSNAPILGQQHLPPFLRHIVTTIPDLGAGLGSHRVNAYAPQVLASGKWWWADDHNASSGIPDGWGHSDNRTMDEIRRAFPGVLDANTGRGMKIRDGVTDLTPDEMAEWRQILDQAGEPEHFHTQFGDPPEGYADDHDPTSYAQPGNPFYPHLVANPEDATAVHGYADWLGENDLPAHEELVRRHLKDPRNAPVHLRPYADIRRDAYTAGRDVAKSAEPTAGQWFPVRPITSAIARPGEFTTGLGTDWTHFLRSNTYPNPRGPGHPRLELPHAYLSAPDTTSDDDWVAQATEDLLASNPDYAAAVRDGLLTPQELAFAARRHGGFRVPPADAEQYFHWFPGPMGRKEAKNLVRGLWGEANRLSPTGNVPNDAGVRGLLGNDLEDWVRQVMSQGVEPDEVPGYLGDVFNHPRQQDEIRRHVADVTREHQEQAEDDAYRLLRLDDPPDQYADDPDPLPYGFAEDRDALRGMIDQDPLEATNRAVLADLHDDYPEYGGDPVEAAFQRHMMDWVRNPPLVTDRSEWTPDPRAKTFPVAVPAVGIPRRWFHRLTGYPEGLNMTQWAPPFPGVPQDTRPSSFSWYMAPWEENPTSAVDRRTRDVTHSSEAAPVQWTELDRGNDNPRVTSTTSGFGPWDALPHHVSRALFPRQIDRGEHLPEHERYRPSPDISNPRPLHTFRDVPSLEEAFRRVFRRKHGV